MTAMVALLKINMKVEQRLMNTKMQLKNLLMLMSAFVSKRT